MENIEKHFCVTTYVLDTKSDKFIFVRHKKLQKWFPAGGHVELNESPDDAAKREVWEETGIKNLKFIEPEFIDNYKIDNLLIRPFGIQLNKVKDNHYHFDLIYFATVDGADLILNEKESEGIEEFSLEEILSPDFDTFENQRQWCKYFKEYVKK